MKKINWMLILSILLLSGCGFAEEIKTKEKENNSILYEYNKDINYTIYNSKMIDTYIIAGALYLDFKSQCLLPNTKEQELYKKAEKYFMSYKDHPFIKSFDKYVFQDDINGDAIGILLSCSNDPYLKPIYKFEDKYRSYIFKEDKEIEEFLSLLRSFYQDTKAEEFFKENEKAYEEMKDYIQENMEKTEIINLIKETEKYVGNKNENYPKENRRYETIMTLFRPSMASFYSMTKEPNHIIITLQSPNDYTKNPQKMNMHQTINTAIHEILHSYINAPVEKNKDLIESLTLSKNKKEYAHSMYEGMPWHRIVDENFVRAIEARIYKKVLGEKEAIKEILEPEIQFGGFTHLKGVYDELEEYEKNREAYPIIEDFMPNLIKNFLQ